MKKPYTKPNNFLIAKKRDQASNSPTLPPVAVLVIHWNQPEATQACISSLFEQDYPDYRIVLCNNGSTDGSDSLLTHWLEIQTHTPKTHLLNISTNMGYAGGINAGINFLHSDPSWCFLWILNNDTTFHPQALRALVAHATNASTPSICGSTLCHPSDPPKIQARGGGTYFAPLGRITILGANEPCNSVCNVSNIEQHMDYVIGASMLIDRRIIDTVGAFSSDYFFYYEDLDYCFRAKKAGFKLRYAHTSFVFHHEGLSTDNSQTASGASSNFADYFALRNRLRFTARHYPYFLPLVYLGFFIVLFNRVRRRQWCRLPIVFTALFDHLYKTTKKPSDFHP